MRFANDVLPPALMRTDRKPASLCALENGRFQVSVDGKGYTFKPDDSDDELIRQVHASGSVSGEVRVQRNGIFFVSKTFADEERRVIAQRAENNLLQESREQHRRATVQRRDVDDVAYLAMQTPIGEDWVPGYKKVLSGLTAKSNGTGSNAQTVAHIVPTRDVQLGRMVRKNGEPLCARNTGSFGINRSVNLHGNEGPSCQSCLRTIQHKANMTLQTAREKVFENERTFWDQVVGEDRSAFFVALDDANGRLIMEAPSVPRWHLVVAEDAHTASEAACRADVTEKCHPRVAVQASPGELYTYADKVVIAEPKTPLDRVHTSLSPGN